MAAAFLLVRTPAYLVGAAVLIAFFPIFILMAALLTAIRLAILPLAFITSALENDPDELLDAIHGLRDVPIFREYADMWSGLNSWWLGT